MDDDRYKWGVMDTCTQLASSADMQADERDERIRWLERRVDTWANSATRSREDYDESVRKLACATLRLCDADTSVDSEPVQMWRIVLNGNVVGVTVRLVRRLRVFGDTVLPAQWEASAPPIAGMDTCVDNTPADVVSWFVAGTSGVSEIVPPGGLTAAEKVEAERAKCVAWLRKESVEYGVVDNPRSVLVSKTIAHVAECIENGKHTKDGE